MAQEFVGVGITSTTHSMMKELAEAEGKFIWKVYDDLLLPIAKRRLKKLNSNKRKNHHGRGTANSG